MKSSRRPGGFVNRRLPRGVELEVGRRTCPGSGAPGFPRGLSRLRWIAADRRRGRHRDPVQQLGRGDSGGSQRARRRQRSGADGGRAPRDEAFDPPRRGRGRHAVARYFSRPGVHPFDEVEWELRSATHHERARRADLRAARLRDSEELVAARHQRRRLEVLPRPPRHARARVERQAADRPRGRAASTSGACAAATSGRPEDGETFQAELTHLLVTQKMAFNSPVWFNLGVAGTPQQASACFINSVDDTMESIMDLAKTEAMLFKGGSGTGSNLSSIRSSREKLAGGGTASGPVSFMRGFDSFAGVVKSGGKTRRAAKMVILNVDHPDIREFIHCKADEEKKAWALIDAGYDGGFNVPGGAYDSVFFQNANHSVRVTDDFMRAALRRRVADARGHDRRDDGHVPRQGSAARDRRGRARVRRSRHAVRHHDQPLEPGQELGPHRREQPVLRVHVPRRHGLQPRQPEPDALRARRTGASTSPPSGTRSRSRSWRRRSWSTSPTTRPRRSRRTATCSARSASATRTSARC